MRKTLLIFSFLLLFLSCKSKNLESFFFERNLTTLLSEKREEFNKTKVKQLLDLKTITEFDWNYFKFISGNESVPVYKEEILCYLNLKEETTDLEVNKSRFYFFKNDTLIKEMDISHSAEHRIYFSDHCSEKNTFESKFLIANKTGEFTSRETTLNPYCEDRIFSGNNLIKYYDYKALVSGYKTKDNGKTYEYNIASEKLIDSIGVNTIFNKGINTKNGFINVTFDVIEARTNRPRNFISVNKNKIVISPNFYENCHKKSIEKIIFHCAFGFPDSIFNEDDFEIKNYTQKPINNKGVGLYRQQKRFTKPYVKPF